MEVEAGNAGPGRDVTSEPGPASGAEEIRAASQSWSWGSRSGCLVPCRSFCALQTLLEAEKKEQEGEPRPGGGQDGRAKARAQVSLIG